MLRPRNRGISFLYPSRCLVVGVHISYWRASEASETSVVTNGIGCIFLLASEASATPSGLRTRRDKIRQFDWSVVNLFHLESRPSTLRKHLPKALFKLAVRKEVGNARLFVTILLV